MNKKSVFDKYFKEYDDWYVKHEKVYNTELKIFSSMLNDKTKSLEVGCGTGKFMLPLNIEFGIDISYSMLKQSGIKNKALQADSVKLPFENNVFNTVLLTTTICFLQKPDISLSEIYRVLKNKGQVIIGFVNKNSVLGKKYQIKKNKSMFYKNAVFYSTEEVLSLLENNKFKDFEVKQILFESEEFDRIEHGYDKGSFVVVKAYKNEE